MRDRFELILEAQPHELPTVIRLRAALKRLLRQFGLRCVALQPQRAVPERGDDTGPVAIAEGEQISQRLRAATPPYVGLE